MNKSRILTYAIGALAIASVHAQDVNSQAMSVSARYGYYGTKGDILDEGLGGQVELKISLGDSPFDLVARAYNAVAELDDDEYLYSVDTFSYGRANYAEAFVIDDLKETIYGGSVQLQYNAMRGELVNFYVAAGAMYERTELEYDAGYALGYRYSYYSTIILDSYGWHEKYSDDGFAFVGRVGIELNPEPLYVRLEAAYFTKIYDEDDAQAELNAIVGLNLTDNLRLDVAGTYFTDWEQYYITGGVTIGF